MKMDYTPNTISYKLIKEKNIDEELFLPLQLKYRKSLENILKKYVSFNSFDELLVKTFGSIPLYESNSFYYKYSELDSKYLFLRNNIHIERLNEKDIDVIKESLFDKEDLNGDFILRTLKEVIFEEGDIVILEGSNEKYSCKANSLIIEFAYNDEDCSLEESIAIKDFFDKVTISFKKFLEPILNMETSFIIKEGSKERNL